MHAPRSLMPGDTRPAVRAVLLATLAVFVNYIDRGNLATAAPLMQDELHLTATQLGVLLSAFYYGYVPCMPVMGWLAERHGAKPVLAASLAVWSLATIMTGFAASFAHAAGAAHSARDRRERGLSLRIEGDRAGRRREPPGVRQRRAELRLSARARGRHAARRLPDDAARLAAGVHACSARCRSCGCGPGAGRRSAPPRRRPRTAPAARPPRRADAPSLRGILGRRALWGASLGHFASNYGYYFIISWLPFYLVKSRGFSLGSMAAIASSAYLLNAVSALAMGWAADRWIKRRTRPDPDLQDRSWRPITSPESSAWRAW